MSSQQILSLETDSDVGFFNDQFKVICAKKYINFLKLNADHVIIVPNDESDNDRTTSIDAKEKNLPESEHQFSFKKFNNTENIKVLIALVVLVIALFIFNHFNHHDELEAILDESVLDTEETEIYNDLSFEDKENQISLFESADISSNDNNPIEQGQDVKIANSSNFGQLNQASCSTIFQSTDIQNYRTPNVPDKPDNYVHIKSNLELPLCIQSNNGDANLFTVTENDPLTFRGQAPFTLYIPNPEGVQVFFQGWQVGLNPNYQVIKINSYKDPNLGSLQ